MSPLDIDGLAAEVSAAEPCGEDLSYDATYSDLERIAQGAPEQVMGDSVIEAVEPDWRVVRQISEELLGRSKDMRVALYLALSAMQSEGLPGLRDGLGLLRRLLETYWDAIHPQLDADDNFDPLERMNIIASLSPPADAYQDPMQFTSRLGRVPLCESRQLGRYSLRDVQLARGEGPPAEGERAAEMSVVEAAFVDSDLEGLQGNARAVAEAKGHLEGIEAFLNEKVGAESVPSLAELAGVLREIDKVLSEQLARRGVGQAAAAAGEADGAAPAAGLSGEIRSVEDVLRAMDKICEYYRRAEPSSPVPLLVGRARRLVSKSFVEIIRDLTPDALRQVQVIGGVDTSEA